MSIPTYVSLSLAMAVRMSVKGYCRVGMKESESEDYLS